MRFDTNPEIYRELQQGYRWAIILGILMMILVKYSLNIWELLPLLSYAMLPDFTLCEIV